MLRTLALCASTAALLAVSIGTGFGQGTPQPGPTNPTSPATNPQAQPGATIVVNPTVEECRQGWNPNLKWTKEQFEHFCTMLRASK
jgi:hypothetical protein